jgi:hypothetical protein
LIEAAVTRPAAASSTSAQGCALRRSVRFALVLLQSLFQYGTQIVAGIGVGGDNSSTDYFQLILVCSPLGMSNRIGQLSLQGRQLLTCWRKARAAFISFRESFPPNA